jgi:hypothetical protein
MKNAEYYSWKLTRGSYSPSPHKSWRTLRALQGCLNGRLPVKFTVRTSAHVRTHPRVYPTDEFLSADTFLPSAPTVFTIRGFYPIHADQAPIPPCHPCLLAPSTPCPPSRPRRPECVRGDAWRNFIFYFWGSYCLLEKRGKKCSVFGFQSTRSPSSTGFVDEAVRRRRFFRPSSPSHPSKLYSSLGWLNSKVPKPFFPFTLKAYWCWWLLELELYGV